MQKTKRLWSIAVFLLTITLAAVAGAVPGNVWRLYVIQDGTLYKVRADDGSYVQLGRAHDWDNSTSMTWMSYGRTDPLFIIQNNVLWSVSKIDGSYTYLSGHWGGTTQMAVSLNGATQEYELYIIQQNQLWKVDRHTGAAQALTGGIWAFAESMVCAGKPGGGDVLEIMAKDTLYEWDIATGTRRILGVTGTWTGPNLMTYYGNLFVIENKRLWSVSTTDGSYQQQGGVIWSGATSISHGIGNPNYIIQNSRLYEVDYQTGARVQRGGAWWPGPTLMVGPFYSDN